MEIAGLFVWLGVLIVDILVNFDTRKSNKEVNENIDALADLVNKSIKQNDNFVDKMEKLADATDKKATSQDNMLWESVIILAKKISNLENQQNV